MNDSDSITREIRANLPKEVFAPQISRLWWLPFHLTSIGLAVGCALWWRAGGGHWAALALPSVIIGFNFGGLAFLAHETLHGAVVKRSAIRKLVGRIGFFPFLVPPRLWVAWHNRVHHRNTNVPGIDPDAYPSQEEYDDSWGTRTAVNVGAPRYGRWRGLAAFLIGFQLQSLQILVGAQKTGTLNKKHHRLASIEYAATIAFWCAAAWWLGPVLFVALYLVPLLIGNSIVMAHIMTNHTLSPQTSSNDTLTSSLTVTVPRWFEIYTLGFGWHVEHHLFPSMPHSKGPLVAAELKRLAPERYQSMSLGRAISLVFNTPRVYKTPTVLWEPQSGRMWNTLGPHPDETSSDEPPASRRVGELSAAIESEQVSSQPNAAAGTSAA